MLLYDPLWVVDVDVNEDAVEANAIYAPPAVVPVVKPDICNVHDLIVL